MSPSFTVMITTRNRVSELRRTLDIVSKINPVPLEILVTADGCSDETVSVLENERTVGVKPIRAFVNEEAKGSVASRDRMMREAKGELVLAIDDDSYPEQMDCLRILGEIFERNAKLAIATFPQRTDEYPETLIQDNFGEARPVRSFPCSGACLRVSTYRSLQGFEPMFFHMYEEPDYALQCVANGWDVLYTPAITVRHHWTGSGRSELRNHHRHARNELWSTVMRCPFPQMLLMIAWRILSQARYAASRGMGWLIQEPFWWWDAIKGIPQAWLRRHAVSWAGYRKWLRLPE
jgi:GT2 family glycosyltransferase